MPKCRTGCLVLHVVRIFGVGRIPPAVIEAEVEFKWILKQTCFSRSEFFKEQTRQSKLWSIPGILVVFLMFSAVKRFQGYWFFFFKFFFFGPLHILFAIMNRPAPVEITYENMRFLITHNPTNATLSKFIEVRQSKYHPSFLICS